VDQNSTFYPSHVFKYEACPQALLWHKGWGTIDLGRGPGRGKKLPELSSRHHAVMGIAIQYAIEKMYNDELYRDPHHLRFRLVELAENEFRRQELKPRNHIDYSEARMSRTEMLEIVRDGVLGYISTMKHHRFLGNEYAKAEVNLVGWVNKWVSVGGRADMIIRRTDTGITILDGKNTKHKMKYVDPDQLRWYAMCFKLAYRVMPDRLGFVWYRFPYGMETLDEEKDELVVEQGVEWVDFTEDDLRGLAQRAIEAREGMRKEQFDPAPSPPNCKWCDFESVCEARQSQRAANAAKRGPSKRNIKEISETGGFVDLSLG
jgi:hypothetical protein